MSVNEDTMVFVDCHDGVANEREPSVEVLEENSSDENARGSEDVSDEREDIVLAHETVAGVKSSIKYNDDDLLKEALDKIKERPRIDAEFQEQITSLQGILQTQNYAPFHDVVRQVLNQLTEAQETAKKSKTSLSRPIEILNEVWPVFKEACAVYTEKVEASPQVNKSMRELERIRLELKECERIDVGDIDKAKKLEKKGEKMLEEAVVHSFEDVERIKEKIRKEEELGILRRFKETRNDTNESMDYLTSDFEQMKNNCAEDIQMTERALQIEIQNKEAALEKFQQKDKELEESIQIQLEKEESLRKQLEEVQEHRRVLEEDREMRQNVQKRAEVVHKEAEDELQELSTNLKDLLEKVATASAVLIETKDVCNKLFNKAIESKNMQNRDMENVLLLTRVNKHNALLAQGVHCLKIKDRESGTIEMLKEKLKDKKLKLHNVLKKHLESDAKKVKDKIRTINADLESSKKAYEKANEKLLVLKQQISDVQRELDAADEVYPTLEQKYDEFKRMDEGDDGYSLTSLSSIS